MIEAILKLAWDLVEDHLKPRIKAAVEVIVQPVLHWFSGLSSLSKKLIVVTLVCCLLSASLMIFLSWNDSGVRIIKEFTAASTSTRRIPISSDDRARADQYTGVWRDLLFDRFDKQVSSMHLGKPLRFETTWTLAQKSLALDGLAPTEDRRVQDLSLYAAGEIDPSCGCWREIHYENQKEAHPLHVAISAWIIVSLERSSPAFDPKHLGFLGGTQLSTGAWPVLRPGGRPASPGSGHLKLLHP